MCLSLYLPHTYACILSVLQFIYRVYTRLNILVLDQPIFSIPSLISISTFNQQNQVVNQTIGCCTASCWVTSPLCVISQSRPCWNYQPVSRQTKAPVGSSACRRWAVGQSQWNHPAIHHYHHIFQKWHEGEGEKSQVLIYIREGKKFFNQTGDDGGEQIKLKVIKASVLWSKLRP